MVFAQNAMKLPTKNLYGRLVFIGFDLTMTTNFDRRVFFTFLTVTFALLVHISVQAPFTAEAGVKHLFK